SSLFPYPSLFRSIHGVVIPLLSLPRPARRAAGSISPAEVETRRRVGTREPVGLTYRCTNEQLPGRMAGRAAQPEDRARQVVPKLPLRRPPTDMAVVHPDVRLMAPAERQRDVIAQQPAPFAGKGNLAIEATHCVAPSNGETVLGHQRGAVPLRAPASGVAQLLLCDLERHG